MIFYLGVALSLVYLTIIVALLLKRQLREKYAFLWLVLGLGTLVIALFPGLLELLSSVLGVEVPSNLFFAIALVLAIGVLLHLSWELSTAEEEIRRLAEESAISRATLAALSDRIEQLELAASTQWTDDHSGTQLGAARKVEPGSDAMNG